MDRQELIDEAIKVTKDTITFCDDWTALDKLMAFVPTERLKEFLPVGEQDQTIEQLEAAQEVEAFSWMAAQADKAQAREARDAQKAEYREARDAQKAEYREARDAQKAEYREARADKYQEALTTEKLIEFLPADEENE